MKIVKVTAIPMSAPVPEERRHRTDLGTKVKSDATLIRVETDNGLTGIGAALGTPPIVAAIVEHELAPECVGEDPMFSERIYEKMYNGSRSRPALERGVTQADESRRRGVIMEAIAGVDIAIWDVKAQALGIPLYQALGAVRSSVRGYASGGWAPGDEAEAELGGYAAKGFTAAKMRVVGRDGFSIANCVRRVKAARRGHRPECRTDGRCARFAGGRDRHQAGQGAGAIRHRLVRGAGVAGRSCRPGGGASIDDHPDRLGRARVHAIRFRRTCWSGGRSISRSRMLRARAA